MHVFQKCHAPLARNIFVGQNRALTTVSCTFCQQRSPQLRKQRYPRSHISRKKTQGFAPESVFARNFAAFLTLPNYLVMSGWHDDVVVMIMWLTWLCECLPWLSSVTQMFSNLPSFDNMVVIYTIHSICPRFCGQASSYIPRPRSALLIPWSAQEQTLITMICVNYPKPRISPLVISHRLWKIADVWMVYLQT